MQPTVLLGHVTVDDISPTGVSIVEVATFHYAYSHGAQVVFVHRHDIVVHAMRVVATPPHHKKVTVTKLRRAIGGARHAWQFAQLIGDGGFLVHALA